MAAVPSLTPSTMNCSALTFSGESISDSLPSSDSTWPPASMRSDPKRTSSRTLKKLSLMNRWSPCRSSIQSMSQRDVSGSVGAGANTSTRLMALEIGTRWSTASSRPSRESHSTVGSLNSSKRSRKTNSAGDARISISLSGSHRAVKASAERVRNATLGVRAHRRKTRLLSSRHDSTILRIARNATIHLPRKFTRSARTSARGHTRCMCSRGAW